MLHQDHAPYRIIQETDKTTDNRWCFRVEWHDETHALYKGHFPFYAIVPGACQLMAVTHCLKAIGYHAHGTQRIKQVKWRQPLFPHQGQTTLVTINKEPRSYNASLCTLSGDVLMEVKGYTTTRPQ